MASSRPDRLAVLLAMLAALTSCATPSDPGTSPGAGRSPTGDAATEAPTPTPEPAGGATVSIPDLADAEIDCAAVDGPCEPGDDADLDQLWQACEDGDGAACDRLYYDSPFDTRYEQYGNTCGDRDHRVPCPGELD